MLDWTLVHGTDAWHARRLSAIGASEIASLFGLQSDFAMSAFTLHQVKSGLIPPPPVDQSPGTRVWRGKRLEPVLADMAAEQFGWQIRYPGPFAVDDKCEGMTSSLDAVIEAPAPDEEKLGFVGPGCLEIKHSQHRAFKQSWTNNEPPYQVILQSQHQLACSGLSWGVVVVDVGETGLIAYRYRARERTARLIRDAVAKFWEGVRDGVPPDPDGTESTAQALKALFPPAEEGKVWESPSQAAMDELDVTAAAFLIAGENEKVSKRVRSEQRNMILWALKGAVRAETENHWLSAKPDVRGAVRVHVAEKLKT